MEELKKSVARIEDKLDKVVEDQSQIKVTQASQAADLKHHIQRTRLNEARIETVEERLIPVVELKNKIDGAFLLLGKVATGLGLLFSAVKVIEVLVKYFA